MNQLMNYNEITSNNGDFASASTFDEVDVFWLSHLEDIMLMASSG